MPFTDMDINLIRQYLNADPNIIKDIRNIQAYRNLRTEQAYYAKLAYEYDNINFIERSKETRTAGEFDRSYWRYKIESLDKARRDIHNASLLSFNNILNVGKKNNLDYLYVGPMLTSDQIVKYQKSENRKDLTDAMFEFLYSIEDSVISSIEKDSNLKDVKQDIDSFNRAYKVKNSIRKDDSEKTDGGIEFDFTSQNNKNISENL